MKFIFEQHMEAGHNPEGDSRCCGQIYFDNRIVEFNCELMTVDSDALMVVVVWNEVDKNENQNWNDEKG